MQDSGINYGMDNGGSGSYISRSSPENSNDILSGQDKEYYKSLASVAVSPKAQTTNADYYPDQNQNVIKGYYEGSILGRMPLVAPTIQFPFAAMDKQEQQQKMMRQAQDNLYLQAATEQYNHIKDARKDAIFVKGQMTHFDTRMKAYQAQFGDYKGVLMYKNSNEYKLDKIKYQNYEKLFDEGFDLAHQVDIARRTQHMPDEKDVSTETETKKGETDKDVTTTTTNKKAGVYVSPKASAAVDRVLTYSMKDPNSDENLENTEQIAKNIKDLQLFVDADAAYATPVNALANSVTSDVHPLLVNGKPYQTQAEQVFEIQTQTGKHFDNWAYAKDEKGNLLNGKGNERYSDEFNTIYNQKYGGLDETEKEMAQHKKEIVDQERGAIADKVKKDIKNVNRGLGSAVEYARLHQESEREAKKYEAKTVPPETDKDLVTGGETHKWNLIGTAAGGKNIITPINTGLKGALIVSYLNTDGTKRTKILDNQEIPAGSDYIVNTYNEETDKSTGNIGGTAYITKPGLTKQAQTLLHDKKIVSVEARVPYSVVKSSVESSGVTLLKTNQGGMVSPAENQQQASGSTVTYKGQSYTIEELKAGGWTDDQIKKNTTPTK